MSYIYQPVGDVPRKGCGCPTFIWCNHFQHGWPSTTATLIAGQLDDGYVGKHRKPE